MQMKKEKMIVENTSGKYNVLHLFISVGNMG